MKQRIIQPNRSIMAEFHNNNFILFFCITILFFGIYAFMQYAPDTYTVFAYDPKISMLHFFSCGRYVTGIFVWIMYNLLNFGNGLIYKCSYSLAIMCTVLSLMSIYKMFKNDFQNNKTTIMAVILIVINVFCVELYMYFEKGILMLSVFMSILAAKKMGDMLNGKTKSYILAVIFMFIACCCYQGTIGIFVLLSLLYIIKYSKNIKEFILNNIIVASVYAISSASNLVLIKLFHANQRVSGNIILSETIQKICQGTENMIVNTYFLFPKYLFVGFICAFIIFFIFKIICNKNLCLRKKILTILSIAYVIIGAVVITVAPQLLQNTQSIWFVPRSSYPFASLLGILIILYNNFSSTLERQAKSEEPHSTLQEKNIKKHIEKWVIFGCLSIILVIQYSYSMRFTIDNYIVNYQDRQITLEIKNAMEKYEMESGNTIKNIAIYSDKNPEWTYYNIHSSGDINVKALYSDWGTQAIIKYYTGRLLNIVESKDEFAQKFKEKDYKKYDDSLIIFEDETMHLCNF